MTTEQFFRHTPLAAFYMGEIVEDETVAFIYPDEEKQLLYRADSVVSVRSYDGDRVYEQGKDYVLRDGKLALTGDSAIPVMTPEVYYSEGDQPILRVLKPDGSESPCIFVGRESLGKYQVRVTYTHPLEQEPVLPPCGRRFGRFLRKLENGEEVTVMFYGDSITHGADSSLLHGIPPFQPSFPILFSCALAELFGFYVRFAQPEAEKAYPGPFPEAPKGGRGTLTLVNTAVGGWTSEDGADRLDTHMTPQIEKYGCDLFVVGFGMNDGGRAPSVTASNVERISRHALSLSPGASVMLVSTMLPNPDASNGWVANQSAQEPELIKLAEKLNSEGCPCDVAGMTSVSAAILKRKKFIDITGNNINHPNDYLSRVYAVTLMQTLIGYEARITDESKIVYDIPSEG